MPIRLFINELSFPSEECSVEQAVERLELLVSAFRAAKVIDHAIRLDSSVSLSQLQIATNWPLAALRNVARCKELGLYIQRLQDRAPFIHALAEVSDDAGGPEYRMPDQASMRAGEIAQGLGLAHQLEGISISLATHPSWSSTAVTLDRYEVDQEGEIQVTAVDARNAVDAGGVEIHAPYLSQFARPTVHDGAELWARRSALFPNLRFIPRVEDQLASLSHGAPALQAVLERLLKLDVAIGIWREAGADRPPYSYFIRRESSGREKYAWFPDDDGLSRLFSLHGDYAHGENRYHFLLEDSPTRTAVVGHIGRKLGI